MAQIIIEKSTVLDGETLVCRLTIKNAHISPWLMKKAKKVGFQDANTPGEDLTHLCHSLHEHKAAWNAVRHLFDERGRWIEPTSIHVRCPKCQSDAFELHEVMVGAITWQVEDGVLVGNGDAHPGDPTKVLGECLQCKHGWTVRKATQITDCYTENRS